MNIFWGRDQIPTQGTKGALKADRSRKYARKMNNAQREESMELVFLEDCEQFLAAHLLGVTSEGTEDAEEFGAFDVFFWGDVL